MRELDGSLGVDVFMVCQFAVLCPMSRRDSSPLEDS